jgi:two-component system, NarL family, invasion response regulator UvrY
MIRTLIVDHHPALRAGVKVVLEAEADMVVVGDTGTQHELLPLLRRTRPDVVQLDCHPPVVVGLRVSPHQVPGSSTSGAHLHRVRR